MKERLTPTFEAASKHTKPMLKSTVSPMRWLSMIQAYVLHCRVGKSKMLSTRATQGQKKCHRSAINLATRAGTALPLFKKSSPFPAHRPPHTPPTTTPSPCSGADLYPLHLQESGHLKSLLPDEQLAVQLHAEEHVLPRLRLHAEAVLPLVQKIVILGGESAARQTGGGDKATRQRFCHANKSLILSDNNLRNYEQPDSFRLKGSMVEKSYLGVARKKKNLELCSCSVLSRYVTQCTTGQCIHPL